MGPEIHQHSPGRRSSLTNSLRDGLRGEEHEERARPPRSRYHHGREAELLLAGPDHDLVLLDAPREHAVQQDPAGQARRPRPDDAGDQEAAELRQGRRVGSFEQRVEHHIEWTWQHGAVPFHPGRFLLLLLHICNNNQKKKTPPSQ
ncbi:unnamed protein product [Linum tenue]|uniref:Uncharacterized protein n=1 Tax=Linum tenue TaxID=586396 RepID=A0AAV0R2E4_9ROSI|nr:unnamed protein product [Linum tenue]